MISEREEASLENSQPQQEPMEPLLEDSLLDSLEAQESPPTQEEPLSQEEPPSQEEPLSQDSPEAPSSNEEESDEVVPDESEIISDEPESEPESESESKPESEETQDAEDAASSEDRFDWDIDGIEALDLASIPSEAREAVLSVLGDLKVQISDRVMEAESARVNLDSQRESFKKIEERFSGFIEALDGDEKERADEYKRMTVVNQLLSQDSTSMAWDAFGRLYGQSYETLPNMAKQEFNKIVNGWTEGEGAAAIEHPTSLFDHGGEGAHYLKRLEAALKVACQRAGATSPEAFSGGRAPARNQGKARRQAAVADSETPPLQPVLTVGDSSYEDILNKHDHLL